MLEEASNTAVSGRLARRRRPRFKTHTRSALPHKQMAPNTRSEARDDSSVRLSKLDPEDKWIDAVDLADVKRVCNEYIYDKCPAVVGLGPVEGLTDYNRIRGGMQTMG